MQEKEYYLNDKFDEFEKTKQMILEEKQKIEKGNKDLMIAARRLDESVKAVDEKNVKLEREKEELMKQFNDLETEKMNINSEKLKIAQEKSDIKLRLQSIDMMRMKYVTEPIGYLPTPSTKQFTSTIQNFSNTNFNSTGNNFYSTAPLNQTNRSNKSFNADQYFNSIQNRINSQKIMESNMNSQSLRGISSPNWNNFNEMLLKEKEFVKQSMDSMNNNTKQEYERMKQNYLNNISSSSNIILHNKEEEVKMDSLNFNKSIKDNVVQKSHNNEIDNFDEIEK